MLDRERRIEPEALGLDAGVDVLAKAAAQVAARGAWRLGTAEQAEAHGFGAKTAPGLRSRSL